MIVFKHGKTIRLIAHGEPTLVRRTGTRFYFEVPRALSRVGVRLELSVDRATLLNMLKAMELT